MTVDACDVRMSASVRASDARLHRVLCVTPWFPNAPGDREGNYIYESCASLARAGLSVSVLVVRPWLTFSVSRRGHEAVDGRFDPAAFAAFQTVRLVRYLSIPRNRTPRLTAWSHDRRVGAALTLLAAKTNPDLIHVHTEYGAAVGTEIGKNLRIPVVVTLHGINTASRYAKSPFLRARFKAGLSAASRVVLVGEPLRKHFADIAGSSANFRVVPNGFRPVLVENRRLFTEGGEPLRFISVCNLNEGKGIDIALAALAKMEAKGITDWIYTVVGHGPERKSLVRLAGNLGIHAKVRFVGARAHNEVYDYLRNADVFVLPSYREAFGIAYLEAMASGLLAIGVNSEGPSAFIRDGETGFLVPPRDSEALAERLLAIANNRARMRAIAVAGQSYVNQHLSWDRHAEKIIEVYREIVPLV